MAKSSDKCELTTEELIPEIYNDLLQVARCYFRRQRPGFTLHPTEMVNEAYLHLTKHGQGRWQSRAHLQAIMAKKIWQILIDHIRAQRSEKRGGLRCELPTKRPRHHAEPENNKAANGHRQWNRVPLESIAVQWRDQVADLLDLSHALDCLEVESPRLNRVVELHWFAGLKHAEVGHALGTSRSTAEKDFRIALNWLNHKLVGHAHDVRRVSPARPTDSGAIDRA